MGNAAISCCRSKSPRSEHHNYHHHHGNDSSNSSYRNGSTSTDQLYHRKISTSKNQLQAETDLVTLQHHSNNLQHISEREPDDTETDPSSNPYNKPIFASRSSYTNSSLGVGGGNKSRGNSVSQMMDTSYNCSNSHSNPRRLASSVSGGQVDYGYNSAASTNLTHSDGSQLITDSFDEQNTTSNRFNDLMNCKSSDHQQVMRLHSGNQNNNGENTLGNKQTNNEIIVTKKNSKNLECGKQQQEDLVVLRKNFSNFVITDDKNQQQPQILYQVQKSSSCSTIFIDNSTISQPNLKQTIKCVSLAIYYHIKNRTSDRAVEIFDETLHPLRLPTPVNTPENEDETTNKNENRNEIYSYGGGDNDDVDDDLNDCFIDEPIEILQQQQQLSDYKYIVQPTQRTIYIFVKTLFKAAQLTSEYAITTLVYLERLMTYAEMDLTPKTWRRMFLGAILLSSKVWEDQAVWNVDYAQILEGISVEDINELERQFLELIQFNMNVPSSVYAKYYFHLRTLSMRHGLSDRYSLLSVGKAKTLEAMSGVQVSDWEASPIHRKSPPIIKRHQSLEKLRLNGQARAVIM